MKNILIVITLFFAITINAQKENPFKKGSYIVVYDTGGVKIFEGLIKEETFKNLPVHKVLIIRVGLNENTKVYKILKEE